MNILVTGASGFIGRNLLALFHEKNINVVALTRNKNNFYDKRIKVVSSLDSIANDYRIDAIVNLAGAAIDKRWTPSYKNTLLESRINVTSAIYSLVARLDHKPMTIISASAVGYYGSSGDVIIKENAKPNPEFTHDLCRKWEKEALKIKEFGCKVAIIRLGVVLGKNGGMLKKVLPPFKLGLGGKIGSGKQYISWVHMHDVLQAIVFLLESSDDNLFYNLTSPKPVTNSEWTSILASAVNRPALLPMHKCLVGLLFGEMGETLLLKGQRVIPNALTNAGFEFKYNTVDKAIYDILN